MTLTHLKILGGVFALLVLLVTALLSYDFEEAVLPEWSVQVVDESGQPVPLATVRATWQYESLDSQIFEKDLLTSEDGRVVFPRQSVRISIWRRERACAAYRSRKGSGAHCGASARVTAFKCEFGADWSGKSYIAPFDAKSPRVESQLVLNRCNAGPEFGCFPNIHGELPRCPVTTLR